MSEAGDYVPSEEEQGNSEQESPREVQLDEEIKPFEDFDDKFRIKEHQEIGEMSGAVSPWYHTDGMGDWAVSLERISSWEKSAAEISGDEQVLVVLPDGERTITRAEVPEYSRKFESRLLELGIIVGRDKDPVRPKTEFSVTLPSGKEVRTNFKSTNFFSDWEGSSGEKYGAVLVPAVANVASRLKVKPEKTDWL